MTELNAHAAFQTHRTHEPSLAIFTNEHRWMLDGACADLTIKESDRIFFPGTGGSAKEARDRFCNPDTCQVFAKCRAYGIKNNQDDGILGGLARRQRRRLAVDGDKALEDGAA